MASHADITGTKDLDLNGTRWDCCVVGNGVAALWVSHWLWSSKKSVLWIASDEPYTPARATLQHAWLWGVKEENAQSLVQKLQGFDAGGSLPVFESIYFDARSSKRFRRFSEAKPEWGDHEKAFFSQQSDLLSAAAVDLWDWHARLQAFHRSGEGQGPTQIELFSEPRFVRVQGWPVIELKTVDSKITSVVLAGRLGSSKKTQEIEVSADRFVLSDFDEYLPGLIKNETDSQALASAIKGRSYRAGFGLRIWHKKLEAYPSQLAIIPLVANPSEKGAGSHVVGRFIQTDQGIESCWTGLLTDKELEDNNEILKKIKQAKRAVDRAIPGFAASIEREAVAFEPRMQATNFAKTKKGEALGAALLSDHYGAQAASDAFKKFVSVVPAFAERQEEQHHEHA